MWDSIVTLSEDRKQVMACLPSGFVVNASFDNKTLPTTLEALNASNYFIFEEEILRFVTLAKEGKGEAYQGILIAEVRNSSVTVELSDDEMLASLVVTGAYNGQALRGSDIIHCLAQAHITKGINKLALRKVLMMSSKLKPGEKFTQPVAKGSPAVKGKDAKFSALVEDITHQVLKPRSKDAGKIDMRDLGETITVGQNDPLMKRTPATKGIAGFTVQGRIIPPLPGQDSLIKPGKGTHISPDDPNLLLSSSSGLPIIKERSIEVDDALCVSNVDVSTGHVKFKGNVFVSGNIEPGMIVKATGSITVGGFIESAEVQAQGDIKVAKGIIGHTTKEDEPKSCKVLSKGSITASYAQNTELQTSNDILLNLHSMSNDIRCGNNLIVMDTFKKHGTLSGGEAKVGGKVECVFLGVEGDTATKVHGFARFEGYQKKIAQLKEIYKHAQEQTMDVIRQELEFKKRPKAERSEEQALEIEQQREKNNQAIEKTKSQLDTLEAEFETNLAECTVEAHEKVYTRVSVLFGDEMVTTKRTHGGSVFSFNQYEIQCSFKMEKEDISL
ncbi:FapA family protein [Vibrio sp. 10N.222.54.F12]|uniref:FapA family protein n=1 Tax=Vibrio atlanticus TaxID=693153 RepID=A0ABV4KL64_9VIBR|nr:FapA family protein [Vibrio tasmaniensis]PML19390.1 polymerase [Vibrio tasmaniensis]PML46663.1 polymerase [Vibrio tasmaniensis]